MYCCYILKNNPTLDLLDIVVHTISALKICCTSQELNFNWSSETLFSQNLIALSRCSAVNFKPASTCLSFSSGVLCCESRLQLNVPSLVFTKQNVSANARSFLKSLLLLLFSWTNMITILFYSYLRSGLWWNDVLTHAFWSKDIKLSQMSSPRFTSVEALTHLYDDTHYKMLPLWYLDHYKSFL